MPKITAVFVGMFFTYRETNVCSVDKYKASDADFGIKGIAFYILEALHENKVLHSGPQRELWLKIKFQIYPQSLGECM